MSGSHTTTQQESNTGKQTRILCYLLFPRIFLAARKSGQQLSSLSNFFSISTKPVITGRLRYLAVQPPCSTQRFYPSPAMPCFCQNQKFSEPRLQGPFRPPTPNHQSRAIDSDERLDDLRRNSAFGFTFRVSWLSSYQTFYFSLLSRESTTLPSKNNC